MNAIKGFLSFVLVIAAVGLAFILVDGALRDSGTSPGVLPSDDGSDIVPGESPSPTFSSTSTSTPRPTSTPTATPLSNLEPDLEALKEFHLELINQDRAAQGLEPVVLGTNTAAQLHAEEMLETGYLSHWDLAGLKPYMRYTLAGGANYEAENVFGPRYYVEPGRFAEEDAFELMEEAEAAFMESLGHRRNILNPWHKKVNLGVGYNGVTAYVVQQFEGDYIDFTQEPTLGEGRLAFSGETREGFQVSQVQIWYDPLPHSLSLGQLGQTVSYCLRTPAAFIRPPAPPGFQYSSDTASYTYSPCRDPYEVDPDTPAPGPESPEPDNPDTQETGEVPWVEAEVWEAEGADFNIEADVREVLLEFGPGVYTVKVWGEVGGEAISLTNYSLFVE